MYMCTIWVYVSIDARNHPCAYAGDITSVVVALGGKTADVGETMLTDGTSNIINAMKAKVLNPNR
jgi:hypothetical protein